MAAAVEEKQAAPVPPAMQLRFVVPPTIEGQRAKMAEAQEAGDDYMAKVMETILTANQIASRGKGLLAADESTGTIAKRFSNIGPAGADGQPTAMDPNGKFNPDDANENVHHQKYRELLFTAPDIENYISGVILFQETLEEGVVKEDAAQLNKPFVQLLQERGIVPGIKVDAGAKQELPQCPGAPYTKGLDSLPEKCQRFYELGARFAKWRSTLKIVDGYISQVAIQETAWTLARYASVCQVNGLAPIVEPEILMDGNHSLAVNQYWTEKVLNACYKALVDQEVVLEGTLLKPNMVLPGQDNPEQGRELTGDAVHARDKEFALATVTALKRSVPAAVPGIIFLSGGQTEEQATRRLNFINQVEGSPWNLSFSYGRALQQSCLQTWRGSGDNKAAAQAVLQRRAKANSEAQKGEYQNDAADTLAANYDAYVKNYVY